MLANPAFAAERSVWVEGGIDCGAWLTAREQGQAQAHEGYLLGFLDAFALHTQQDIWRRPAAVTRQQVFFWVDRWCRENPLMAVRDAAIAFEQERVRAVAPPR
jgi:hypothetical protein